MSSIRLLMMKSNLRKICSFSLSVFRIMRMHDLRMESRKKGYFKSQKKEEKKRMKWMKSIIEE